MLFLINSKNGKFSIELSYSYFSDSWNSIGKPENGPAPATAVVVARVGEIEPTTFIIFSFEKDSMNIEKTSALLFANPSTNSISSGQSLSKSIGRIDSFDNFSWLNELYFSSNESVSIISESIFVFLSIGFGFFVH